MAFSNHDIVPDSPTNNFATLNNLCRYGSSQTFSEGNLKVTTSSSGYETLPSTIPFPKGFGKWYLEILIVDTSGYDSYGILPSNYNTFTNSYPGAISGSYGYLGWIGSKKYDGGSYLSYEGETFASNGNLMGLLFNAENGTLEFFKNGNSQGVAFTAIDTSTEYIFGLSDYNGSADATYVVNFGQDPTFGGATNLPTGAGDYDTDAAGNSTGGRFAFQPPTGALALCTANLPKMTPDVDDDFPQDYFKAVTYTGNGVATSTGASNTISIGMPADLIWIKRRDASNHHIVDTVRGIGTGRYNSLASNNNNQQTTSEVYSGVTGGVTDIDHTNNEFTVHGRVGWVGGDINEPSKNYIAWCWKAGGAPTASDDGNGVSGSAKLVNTSGTASSTTCRSFKDAAVTAGASNVICPSKMSINQAAGFSIVEYTGNGTSNISIPHGLGKRPSLWIGKNTDNSGGDYHWQVHFVYDTNSREAGYLNLTNTFGVDTTRAVNDNIMEVTTGDLNRSTGKNISYIWSEIPGYSSFGKWTGDGSTGDGPFIYTGFRPAFIFWQNSDSGSGAWALIDGTRDPYNPVGTYLYANTAADESTTTTANDIDFLSNGFKLRGTGGSVTNNEVCWYAAFAEQPFNYANAR